MDESQPPDRIDRIEERVARLESGLDELRDALAVLARSSTLAMAEESPGREAALAPPAPDSSGQVEPMPTEAEGTAESVRGPSAKREPWPRRAQPVDIERWLGQNALLVVGVLALVAAVAFTLKYAFDQGWVSPAARVGAGIIVGAAITAYGERLLRGGMRRFGAGLQGAGAAIVYLSVWAAAGPFNFVSAGPGVVALAAISALLMLGALRAAEPYLAGLAAAGAYIAPLLLADAPGGGGVLLGYAAAISVSAGTVAVLRRWRATLLVVILGFFLLAAGAYDADLWLWVASVATGAGLLLAAANKREWRSESVLTWSLGWVSLLIASHRLEGWPLWLVVAAPSVFAFPVWNAAMMSEDGGSRPRWDDTRDVLRAIVFYTTAILWTLVVTDALRAPASAYPLAAAAVVAGVFLAPGWLRQRPAMHVAGLAVLALGVGQQWDGTAVAAGLVAPALLAAVSTRSGPLAENRWMAPALMAVAVYTLFNVGAVRPEDYPALTGPWAGALYLQLVALVAIAGPLWKPSEASWDAPGGFPLRTATWLLTALLALAGGTTEIPSFVVQHGGSRLAAGLAVSAYWLFLAGAFLTYGFWKDRRAVRITGLAFAALAVGKVLFVDLAELRALYRVGSLALLALITLLGARAYYRREPPA